MAVRLHNGGKRKAISSDQSSRKRAGGGRSEMPGETPPGGKIKTGTGQSNQSSVISDHQSAAGEPALATLGAVGVRCEMGSSELPESAGDFVLHDADDQWVMRQECPEFRGSGGGRGDGVKAVEGSRTPSPGGTTARLGSDEPPRRLRRGVSETVALGADAGSDGPAGKRGVPDLNLVPSGSVKSKPPLGARHETAEILESECDFVLQTAGVELHMPHDCPEIHGGKAPLGAKAESGKLKVEIQCVCGGQAAQQRAESPGQRFEEIPDSGFDFILQVTDDELLIRQKCPEFSRPKMGIASGNRRRRRWANLGGAGKWTGFCHLSRVGEFPYCVARGGATRQPWLLEWHPSGMRDIPADGGEIPESRWGFIIQSADRKWLMRQDCPEFGRGGGGRGAGVKAVEGSRSPSPGGRTEPFGMVERSWVLRQGLNEADGGWVVNRRREKLNAKMEIA